MPDNIRKLLGELRKNLPIFMVNGLKAFIFMGHMHAGKTSQARMWM